MTVWIAFYAVPIANADGNFPDASKSGAMEGRVPPLQSGAMVRTDQNDQLRPRALDASVLAPLRSDAMRGSRFPALGSEAMLGNRGVPEGSRHSFEPAAKTKVAENNQKGLRLSERTDTSETESATAIPPMNSDVPYDDTLIRNSVGNLYKFIEGSFGALLVVCTGIGAIIAATMGSYKTAVTLLVVSIGAFILRAYVSLFFGVDYPDYQIGEL